MSFGTLTTTGTPEAQQFMNILQQDFRQLSSDTKKKHPTIRDVCKRWN